MKVLIVTLLLIGIVTCLQEIDSRNFDSLVKNDNNVWVLKIASKMCGSCKEFEPIFESSAKKNTQFKFGVVYIDEKEGLDLAMNLNVLDNGLPAVVVYDTQEGSPKQIVSGNVIKENAFNQQLVNLSKNLKLKDGVYQKSGNKADL